MVEEKATAAVALIEPTKKEATEAVSRFKASVEFIEEVREAVVDFLLKGFMNCKVKLAQAQLD